MRVATRDTCDTHRACAALADGPCARANKGERPLHYLARSLRVGGFVGGRCGSLTASWLALAARFRRRGGLSVEVW